MRKKVLLSVSLFMATVFMFSVLFAEDITAKMKYDYVWDINGNGHVGVLQYNLDGYKLTGSIYDNAIEGFQVGRHVVFYRSYKDNQIWTGWIWDGRNTEGPTIAGTFSHRGENSYPWSGIIR